MNESEVSASPAWPAEVAKCLQSHHSSLSLNPSSCASSSPSPELAQLVVSLLCFDNNHPTLWKFLHQAISSRLVSPLQVLSLLTSRVIPCRNSQPKAYRLYLELVSRYAFTFEPVASDSCRRKIVESVDYALGLSQTYGSCLTELGHMFVLFFFSIVTELLNCTLDDWGLKRSESLKAQSMAITDGGVSDMDVDSVVANKSFEKNYRRDFIGKRNPFLAIEVLEKLTENRKAKVLLRLVYLNMPREFNGLLQKLQCLDANKLTFSKDKSEVQLLTKVSANIRNSMDYGYQLNKHNFIGMLINTGSSRPVSHCNNEFGRSACWVSFDIYMENAMDGRHLPIKSAVAILTETIITLRVINRASWQETFLELWISALRLVQREREPPEGPIPHLEARLCVLLSIVPLAIANLLEDDVESSASSLQGPVASGFSVTESGVGMLMKDHSSRRQGLYSSLQLLGNFSGLLCPPTSVADAANSAAAKAATFISNAKNAKDVSAGTDSGDSNPGGNMRHLIVEACIARKLIDTSAFFWHGYVSASLTISDVSPIQTVSWSSFMEGAPLKAPLINLLLTTPAPSLAEVEKLYNTALSGTVEEKTAAAKILCGATLSRGWNIQEHVVRFVLKLLSPPVPPGYSGPGSHLVDSTPMLSALLFGASSIDTVHILSLHGVVPEVAAALLPLCEVFGSLIPTSANKSKPGDEPSIYMVFSSAFLFLLRLWKFYRPPLEQCITGGSIGIDFSLEYLLLLRNNCIASHSSHAHDPKNVSMQESENALDKPIYIDSFPKLRAWYCQNKSCIASIVGGLCTGSSIHQVADKILTMIFSKLSTHEASSANSPTPSSSSKSGTPSSTREDAYERPILTAWEVLEAVPFVLEAMLTACAHGRLSSRDLTTGLRDLVDFLPASLATVISYFSAEVTRGIWKPVPMNGTDWPSPSAILSSVESDMKEILAAAGVNVPICSSGVSPVTLPLPVAALVSLTITFKLTKGLEYIHAVVGPALESCASSCPWPSVPIIGSLWAQKVRRWHNFILVSCSRSVFRKNNEAVLQLLRSCFSSFIGSVSKSSLTSQGNITGLLGSIVGAPEVCPSLAPGFLYLRSCRTINSLQYVNDTIIELVAEYARESAVRWAQRDSPPILKSSQASLSLGIAKARDVAILGASLLAATGGLQLVQELYRETMPTRLLASKEDKSGEVSGVGQIMEGYALAYLMILSGSLVWGVGAIPPSYTMSKTRRSKIVGGHMEFLGRVLDGNVLIGCHPATWKAYVSCLVGLIVTCAPSWIEQVKMETLRKLASGLRGWHECELALSLLELCGLPAMESISELLDLVG